jgi:hypothetical protein
MLTGIRPFLDLGARPTQSGDIGGVDHIDPVADKRALPPTDHLLAHPRGARRLAVDGIVVIDERIEDLRTRWPWPPSLRLLSLIGLIARGSSSLSSKSYQYLPRTNTPLSP